MVVGEAETNWIAPSVAAATVIVPVADSSVPPTVAEAVMVSVPEHPNAVYVAVAEPLLVVTVLDPPEATVAN